MLLVSSIAALVLATAVPATADVEPSSKGAPTSTSTTTTVTHSRPAAVPVHAHATDGRRGARKASSHDHAKTADAKTASKDGKHAKHDTDAKAEASTKSDAASATSVTKKGSLFARGEALSTLKPAHDAAAKQAPAKSEKTDAPKTEAKADATNKPANVSVTASTSQTTHHRHHRHQATNRAKSTPKATQEQGAKSQPKPSKDDDAPGARLPELPALALSLPVVRVPELALSTSAASNDDAETTHPSVTHKAASCIRKAVTLARGHELLETPLTRCDGAALPHALDSLSVLARSESSGTTKRLDARVVERLQVLIDHFEKDGNAPRIEIVAGYRPLAKGPHARGRALDFRFDGVEPEDVLAYCHTLADTGCGLYPSGNFVHMDVRTHGAGRVAWIDSSSDASTVTGLTKKSAPSTDEHITVHADEPDDPADHDDE